MRGHFRAHALCGPRKQRREERDFEMGNSDSKLQAPATPSESSSDEAARDPFAYVPLLPFSKKLTLQPPIAVNRRNKTSTPRNGKSPPIKTKARKDAEKGKSPIQRKARESVEKGKGIKGKGIKTKAGRSVKKGKSDIETKAGKSAETEKRMSHINTKAAEKFEEEFVKFVKKGKTNAGKSAETAEERNGEAVENSQIISEI